MNRIACAICCCLALIIGCNRAANEPKGIDPNDPSVVYDEAWVMVGGAERLNGKAYDKCTVCLGQVSKLVLPSEAIVLRREDNEPTVTAYTEKRVDFRSHTESENAVARMRPKMGCAAKLEKGELFLGSFGEFSFMEGSASMKFVVFAPAKIEILRRNGLLGGPGGRAGGERSPMALNPIKEELKAPLSKTKEGDPKCYLAPTAEDGWHEIPAVADPERKASK